LGAIVIIVIVGGGYGGTDGGGTKADGCANAWGPAPAINAAAISYAVIHSTAINSAHADAACADRAGVDTANADAAAAVRGSVSGNACDTKSSSGDGSDGSIRHGMSFFRSAPGRWPSQCQARTVRLPLKTTVNHGW